MILIDPREGSGDLILLPPLSLCAECGAECEISYSRRIGDLSNCTRYCPFDSDHSLTAELSPLQFGDISFHGNNISGRVSIGIEIKTVSELVTAIDSGRLADVQLRGMLNTYSVSILAVYGRSQPGADGELQLDSERYPNVFKTHKMGDRGIPAYSAVDSFLYSPQLYDAGVSVVRLDSKPALALWVHSLARSWGRSYESHDSLRVFHRPALPDLSDAPGANILTLSPDLRNVAHFLSGLPGVRYARGIAAALHFGSIYAAIRADVADWAEVQVKGKTGSREIGKKAAKRIVDYIRKNCKSRGGKL